MSRRSLAPGWLRRHVWIVPVLGLVGLVFAGTWVRSRIEDAMRDDLEGEMVALLNADVTALKIWLRAQEAEAVAAGGEPAIRQAIVKLAEAAKSDDSPAAALLQAPPRRAGQGDRALARDVPLRGLQRAGIRRAGAGRQRRNAGRSEAAVGQRRDAGKGARQGAAGLAAVCLAGIARRRMGRAVAGRADDVRRRAGAQRRGRDRGRARPADAARQGVHQHPERRPAGPDGRNLCHQPRGRFSLGQPLRGRAEADGPASRSGPLAARCSKSKSATRASTCAPVAGRRSGARSSR